jgi:hypothetical protein
MTPGAGDGPLDALAAGFAVVAKSGVYLTKNELVALARVSEASLRINERKRMLADVLKSAQTPAELAALNSRLIEFCRLHLEEYEAQAVLYPKSRSLLLPWVERARATIARLEGINEELALSENLST